MNTINPRGVMLRKTLIATTVASVLLAACAAAPVKPDGAAEARSKLTQLQSDPNLAGRPQLIKGATQLHAFQQDRPHAHDLRDTCTLALRDSAAWSIPSPDSSSRRGHVSSSFKRCDFSN